MFWNTKKFARERLSLRMLKHSAPVLSLLAQEQIKQRLLLSIQNQPVAAPARFTPSAVRFPWAKLAAASAFGLLAIAGTAYASNAANPGDILYPVKRAQETVRLSLAPSEEGKAELQASFARERIREFKNAAKTKNSGASLQTISSQNAVVQIAAKKEIKNALRNLRAAEARLKKQGKMEAAMSVRANIKRVGLEAKEQNLIEAAAEN